MQQVLQRKSNTIEALAKPGPEGRYHPTYLGLQKRGGERRGLGVRNDRPQPVYVHAVDLKRLEVPVGVLRASHHGNNRYARTEVFRGREGKGHIRGEKKISGGRQVGGEERTKRRRCGGQDG